MNKRKYPKGSIIELVLEFVIGLTLWLILMFIYSISFQINFTIVLVILGLGSLFSILSGQDSILIFLYLRVKERSRFEILSLLTLTIMGIVWIILYGSIIVYFGYYTIEEILWQSNVMVAASAAWIVYIPLREHEGWFIFASTLFFIAVTFHGLGQVLRLYTFTFWMDKSGHCLAGVVLAAMLLDFKLDIIYDKLRGQSRLLKKIVLVFSVAFIVHVIYEIYELTAFNIFIHSEHLSASIIDSIWDISVYSIGMGVIFLIYAYAYKNYMEVSKLRIKISSRKSKIII